MRIPIRLRGGHVQDVDPLRAGLLCEAGHAEPVRPLTPAEAKAVLAAVEQNEADGAKRLLDSGFEARGPALVFGNMENLITWLSVGRFR
jgi:hypothetical protein